MSLRTCYWCGVDESELQDGEQLIWTGYGQTGMYDGHFVCSACAVFDKPIEDREPSHQLGCICADCSGAELTADND